MPGMSHNRAAMASRSAFVSVPWRIASASRLLRQVSQLHRASGLGHRWAARAASSLEVGVMSKRRRLGADTQHGQHFIQVIAYRNLPRPL